MEIQEKKVNQWSSEKYPTTHVLTDKNGANQFQMCEN